MGLVNLLQRYLALAPAERRYYLRRFVDQKVHARPGFAQFGEDASVALYLRTVGRHCHHYIDIGANDPVIHSNTYLFYRDGGTGLLVDANPDIAARLRKARPRDTVVNAGVLAQGGGTLDLHIMDFDGLSTLSAERKAHIDEKGLAVESRTVSVPIIGINEVLQQHAAPDAEFASIDIEGPELEVLGAWDFDRWRPFLFCVETTLIDDTRFFKDERLTGLMVDRGYRPLFETFANTIFVDAKA